MPFTTEPSLHPLHFSSKVVLLLLIFVLMPSLLNFVELIVISLCHNLCISVDKFSPIILNIIMTLGLYLLFCDLLSHVCFVFFFPFILVSLFLFPSFGFVGNLKISKVMLNCILNICVYSHRFVLLSSLLRETPLWYG